MGAAFGLGRMTEPNQTAGLDLSNLPCDDAGEPIFAEPWQAQAFAMVLKLHQDGVCACSPARCRHFDEALISD